MLILPKFIKHNTETIVNTYNYKSFKKILNLKREVGIDIKVKKQVASNIAITHHPCSIVYCMCLLKYRIAAG